MMLSSILSVSIYALLLCIIAYAFMPSQYQSTYHKGWKSNLMSLRLQSKDSICYPASNVKVTVSCRDRYLNRFESSYRMMIPYRASRSSLSMVSVGPGVGGGMPDPPRSKAFIISPSINSAESEMLILQNFNQIQQGDRSTLGILGTNNLSDDHKQMVELLTYALVLSGNHIYTSGGGNGTNIAVVKGALRACNPDLLTVVLPQSLYKQPPEIQPLLSRVANLIQQPENDDLDLKDAAMQCNEQIIAMVDKILVFAYHDSTTILDAVTAVQQVKGNVIFYLD